MFAEIQSDIEYKVNEMREGRLTVMGKTAIPKPAPGRGYPTNPEELEPLKCSFDGANLGYMESVRYGDRVERFRSCMKCGYQWNEKHWKWLRLLAAQPQTNPKQSLQYYAITYGGVPMTAAGRQRFIKVAMMNGYSKAEIDRYLKTEKNPIPVLVVAAGAHVAGKTAEYIKKKRAEKAAKAAAAPKASNPKTRTGLYHPKKGTKEARDFMARLRAMRKKK
jgi:hypothetical protein